MATKQLEETKEKGHIHKWATAADQASYICYEPYAGYPCNKIKLGQEEFDRRTKEWNAFYKHCHTTPAYEDYKTMQSLVKEFKTGAMAREAFLLKRDEIEARIATRMSIRTTPIETEKGTRLVEDFFLGQSPYVQPNANYTPRPDFSDPADPKQFYFVEGAA